MPASLGASTSLSEAEAKGLNVGAIVLLTAKVGEVGDGARVIVEVGVFVVEYGLLDVGSWFAGEVDDDDDDDDDGKGGVDGDG